MPMPDTFPQARNDSPFASMRAHHVGLRVDDVEAAIRWYTEALDFRVMHSFSLGARRFVYLAPAANDDFGIELLGGQPTVARPTRDGAIHAGWDHLCLEVDSADDMIAELRRRGATILREPFDVAPISRRIAFFADPWGNTFELFQKREG